jgi:hypothetical protein
MRRSPRSSNDKKPWAVGAGPAILNVSQRRSRPMENTQQLRRNRRHFSLRKSFAWGLVLGCSLTPLVEGACQLVQRLSSNDLHRFVVVLLRQLVVIAPSATIATGLRFGIQLEEHLSFGELFYTMAVNSLLAGVFFVVIALINNVPDTNESHSHS